jgi:hypothetical protein
VTLYHVTTPEAAAGIQCDGFIDRGTEHGVWLSDQLLWELVPNPVAFEIDLSLESVIAYECTTPDHGYRRWLVPCGAVNLAARRLLPQRSTGG